MRASPAGAVRMSVSPNSNHLLTAFQEHYADLLAFLARRLGNVEKAADVAQDTYLRLAGLGDTAQILEPRAFVFRVAGNLAIDRLRQEQRHAAWQVDAGPDDEACDPMASPERSFLAAEAIEQLDKALHLLPSNARLALLLNRIEGLTHAQIAMRLGVSESMVGKYIVQAMRHCRDWLRQSECL
jgi:RNA polymerase sigma factor (sigma-70 family)